MEFNLDSLLYICSIIVSVAGAAGIVTKVFKKQVSKQVEDFMKIKSSDDHRYDDRFESKLDELHKLVLEFTTSQSRNNELVARALLSTIRDRINQAHDYYMKIGFIGAHSLFVLEEMYTCYKELGGNSFVDKQMEELRDLPVESAETK